MVHMNENIGWVCPKCGAPNSPSNTTCAACFSSPQYTPHKQIPEWAPHKPDHRDFLTEAGTSCPKCGILRNRVMGYVCSNLDCPNLNIAS
jgi:hypothetical protein